MTAAHEEVVRDGFHLTRQHWQRFDRINAHPEIRGMLVVVQGGRSFAAASGTTHRLLGVADYRRWNLTDSQASVVVRQGRDLSGTCWERFTWQGFDPHFHDCTLGDDIPEVMDGLAIQQCATYKAGGDGVSGTSGDSNPYRPSPIHNYVFLEDDMDADERKELFRIGDVLDKFRAGEYTRDQREAEKDKARFTAIIKEMGEQADQLTVLINKTDDAATQQELRKVKERILRYLKDHPDVTGVDNPDDDQMP